MGVAEETIAPVMGKQLPIHEQGISWNPDEYR